MSLAFDEQRVFGRFFPESSSPEKQALLRIVRVSDPLTEQQVFLRFFDASLASTAALKVEPVQKVALEVPSARPAKAAADALVEPESKAHPAKILPVPAVPPPVEVLGKESFFSRVKRGLSRTRSGFTEAMASLLAGKKAIDADLLEEIETQLLMADVGVSATQRIVTALTQKVSRRELVDSDALYHALQQELAALLSGHAEPWQLGKTAEGKPRVILMVGVNGVGKTTTIGKLAKRLQIEGKQVMLAAGDTFRAAAVEQLQVWGQRNEIAVVAQHTGADSASVIFDALQSATAKKVDVLIADTAGRLHTKSNLMEELKKVKRVMQKLDPQAPHEVLLVLDAGTGQNALSQATQFNEAVGVTGIVLTKLDGTAKGGIVFAIAEKTGIPIRLIGVGETIDDLRPFEPQQFVKALFAQE
ncbi:Cell division protein, SRP docking protein [gamma proteobacterium HdN1]|nr:Cell division protein, SRP docking protein [gamma proteobacterium HdN1]